MLAVNGHHRPGLIDAASWHYPFASLAGHGRDTVEVSVVMQHDQACVLSSCCYQQVGDLPTRLTSASQQTLYLACSLHMTRFSFKEAECLQRPLEAVPFPKISRRIADLEVGDSGTSQPSTGCQRLDY